MNKIYTSLILVTTLLITACATPLSKDSLNNVKTIGLLNSFPESPNYLSIGLTIFENETSALGSITYKDYITSISTEYLQNRGYKVIMVNSRDALDNEGIDMVIDILPRDAYQKPGTFGYGFYQRTIFGSTVGNAQSYVVLNLSPSSTHFSSAFSAYYKESFVDIHLKTLPEKWESIPDDEKVKMTTNLKENINKTIISLFKELGV